MGRRLSALLDRAAQRRAARAWSEAANAAERLDLSSLRALRQGARASQAPIDRILRIADSRLDAAAGRPGTIPRPLHSDWAWRPALFTRKLARPGHAAVDTRTPFGDATVFHDCRVSELTVRQIANRRETDLAPYGVRLDVFRFDGSFLSLALDLPPEAVDGLKLRHLVRMDCDVEVEKPLEIFARLNIVHGPNTEQLVRELPSVQGQTSVDFDLAYTRMNERRIEKAWVDIIFEGPQLNQIVLHDLTFSRRPRADL
jgi:Family of unknown function (DUF6478)